MKTEPFLPADLEKFAAKVQTSSFLKLENGETKVRLLSNPVIGTEFWIDGKPKRTLLGKPLPVEAIAPGAEKTKRFWGMKVYDYKSKSVKIWGVTQVGIHNQLKSLDENSSWGSPLNYDITIKKTGIGLDTTYAVLPCPKEPLSAEVEALHNSAPVDLNALFVEGGKIFIKVKPAVETDFSDTPF